jgi:hypothetical protein
MRADELYFAVRDYDRLVFLRRRTCSIDDPDMVKNEDSCINAYEVRDARRLLCLRNSNRGN